MKSGDVLFIKRLDGVDPMIQWALGSAMGNFKNLILN